jgi:pyruvate,water dikinase
VAPWIVQARPIVHRVAAPRRPAPPSVTALLVADGRTWSWDVAHNPDPLSPAQAGLVQRVDRAGIAPWSLRVCAGFLYAARRDDLPAHDIVAPTTIATLEARVHELETAMEAALAGPRTPDSSTRADEAALTGALTASRTANGGGSTALVEAINRYLAFYAIWANELAPLIAAARADLSPAQLAGARPSSVESTLLAAARGELDETAVLDRIGVMSPAWDVSVPTFAERPELVRAAIERARALIAVSSPVAATPDTLHHRAHVVAEHAARDLARAAADLAERDDVWFARAQWLVRAAILECARELGLDPDDAFWIPLDELAYAATDSEAAPRSLDADDARRLAAGARSAAARAAQWSMPIVVGGEEPESAEPRRAFTGVGTGPRVTGRAVRFESLASTVAVTSTDVVVTRAVTPALAVLVIGCAALVSETGGLLDHGAALARELGIPCVVGCEGAWALADGMIVTVDGDAGAVEVRAR